MSTRRRLGPLAALAAAVLVSGCAATVSGHGALAAGVRTPTGHPPGAADHGSGSPAPTTARPSGSPAATDGAEAGGDDASTGPGKVCSLFRSDELTTLFGEAVTAKPDGDDRSCSFQTQQHGGVLVNVYDFLNLTEEASHDPGGYRITVAGHPAYQGKREILVARSSNPSAAGLIVASNLFVDNEARGNQIAGALLNRIVPKFAD